jgi:hypothetical protein
MIEIEIYKKQFFSAPSTECARTIQELRDTFDTSFMNRSRIREHISWKHPEHSAEEFDLAYKNHKREEKEVQTIVSGLEEGCLALGVKCETHPSLARALYLRCTPKQLERVFTLREGLEISFYTRLTEAKCKRVLEFFKGTELESRLSYGRGPYSPFAIEGSLTSYEDYSLVMSKIKDVRKNTK